MGGNAVLEDNVTRSLTGAVFSFSAILHLMFLFLKI